MANYHLTVDYEMLQLYTISPISRQKDKGN